MLRILTETAIQRLKKQWEAEYKASPEYRAEALKFAFENQSKPSGFQNLVFVFTDSNNKHYYRYINDEKIPITRLEGIQKTYLKLRRRADEDEIEGLVEAAKTEIDRMVKSTKKIEIKDLAKVYHILDEMVKRDSILLHEPLLMEMAAHLNIREDENPETFDADILDQKIEQFTKDSRGGLRDFFYQSGLTVYLPYSDITDEQWEGYLETSREILKGREELIRSLTSEVKSQGLSKAE